VPALAADQRTRRVALIPQSECVTFSNLRETVVALADPAPNPQVREAFYAHNPIPRAIWRVERGSHVLENPDEIMPEVYEIPAYRQDIRNYTAMFAWMQHKVPKYVKTGAINYEEQGGKVHFRLQLSRIIIIIICLYLEPEVVPLLFIYMKVNVCVCSGITIFP
jgi:hypothetical protein